MYLLPKYKNLLNPSVKRVSGVIYHYVVLTLYLIVVFSSCNNHDNSKNAKNAKNAIVPETNELRETISKNDFSTDSIQFLLEKAIATNDMMSVTILPSLI